MKSESPVGMKLDNHDNQAEPPSPAKGRRRMTRRSVPANEGNHLAGIDTLTRTKALLLAALRVWELKQRPVD